MGLVLEIEQGLLNQIQSEEPLPIDVSPIAVKWPDDSHKLRCFFAYAEVAMRNSLNGTGRLITKRCQAVIMATDAEGAYLELKEHLKASLKLHGVKLVKLGDVVLKSVPFERNLSI